MTIISEHASIIYCRPVPLTGIIALLRAFPCRTGVAVAVAVAAAAVAAEVVEAVAVAEAVAVGGSEIK